MTELFEKQITAIKNIFPAHISAVTVHEKGAEFLVLEINHEWMFRFPRNDASRSALKVESAFLTRFKPLSSLPVPDHLYIGNDFVGYPTIQGTPLSIELFHRLSKESVARIAQQLGQFLSGVHNFPVNEAKQIGLTGDRDDGYIQAFQEVLAPMLSPSACRNGLAFLEQMLAEKFEAKVIHGDFALEDHVFLDEARQELRGVIDFGDVTLYDPAHDFQNIVEYGGNEFFEAVMNHYLSEPDPALFNRTKLRIQARPLFEAFWLRSAGLEQEFKKRIEYIEAKYG